MNTPEIIFEDEFILVLDKPSGWVVNNSNTIQNLSLQDWISKNYNFPTAHSKEFRSGIVHRLDKETSGLILVGKDEKTFSELQDQFKQRAVKKEYQALVHGKVAPKEGTINAPVGRLPWKRTRFGVLENGREAVTDYKVEKYFTKNSSHYSLLTIYPKTGRTHQIRIHLKSIHHPVVGDLFYAGRKVAKADRIWCPHLFLHASVITFTHPQTQKQLTVKSELPQDLQKIISSFSHTG